MGDNSLWGVMETTFNSSEKWKILIKDTWDNFDDTGKKSFSYLEGRSQKLKTLYTPHKSFSH